ncbi:MAG TPA: alpha/beta fold hydrolase [Fimbriimonadaceae bacterium]|nr:alpha/beta fold hydrolase [Fimbriimonadaceae bacterium]
MRLDAVFRKPLATAGSNPPLLVLLHGLAADEHDLIGLADELDPRLAVVSIRAPYSTGYGGYAWFGIEFLNDGRRMIDEDQALTSLEILVADLRELAESLSPSRFILAGFSQGAMMAAGVVFRHSGMLDAAWLMSGRLLPSFVTKAVPERPLPILQQHGLYDEVLPVTEGRELAQCLRAKGHDPIYTEYPMAHQISFESLEEADRWMRQTVLD